jgi:UDP-glucose 6-dehydrogenase
MKIVIAGYGPVGQAAYAALSQRNDVDLYIDDPYKEYNYPDDMVDSVDAVVVAVATPVGNDGACDTSNVEAVFAKYGDVKYLVKSTTDPDFILMNSRRDLTFSPEYLRGTTGFNPTEEFLNSEFAVYGGGSMRFWHELFLPVLPNLKEVRFMTAYQAAFVKYMLNCFLATKVTFFNQAYEIFKAFGGEEFDVVIDGVCLDPRVGYSHTQVPGPDGKFGFGGHCFPKDMRAFIALGREMGTDVSFLESVLKTNERQRDE